VRPERRKNEGSSRGRSILYLGMRKAGQVSLRNVKKNLQRVASKSSYRRGRRGCSQSTRRKAFNRKGRKERPQRAQRQAHHRDTEAQRRSGDLVIGSSGERAPESQVARSEYRFASPFHQKMASRARSTQLIRAQECARHTVGS
jgi:hypothetical protein